MRRRFQGAGRSGGGRRSGSALVVALWVLVILTLLIGSFAFDMQIEANVASYQRKRVKAAALAEAGIEWTKALLARQVTKTLNSSGELVVEEGDDQAMAVAAYNLSRGVGVANLKKELGEGAFDVSILPEESRRNVNLLTDLDWDEILDQAAVPEEKWDEIKDCFFDYTDPGDEHRLNGAEKDDAYYEERDYEPKNKPLDTVDELLLIKGFTPALLYGGPSPYGDKEPPLRGIAGLLTTWGDGKVNVNTASREVLLTLPNIEDYVVEKLLERRSGLDGESGTIDDGFQSVEEAISFSGMDPKLSDRITTTERKYLRIVSIGEVGKVRAGIWAIVQQSGRQLVPVFWREEAME